MADATEAAMNVLAEHRWKSMGVRSAECECGATMFGAAAPFPADAAFRRHLASVMVAAVEPLIAADVRAAEVQRWREHILNHARQLDPYDDLPAITELRILAEEMGWTGKDDEPFPERDDD